MPATLHRGTVPRRLPEALPGWFGNPPCGMVFAPSPAASRPEVRPQNRSSSFPSVPAVSYPAEFPESAVPAWFFPLRAVPEEECCDCRRPLPQLPVLLPTALLPEKNPAVPPRFSPKDMPGEQILRSPYPQKPESAPVRRSYPLLPADAGPVRRQSRRPVQQGALPDSSPPVEKSAPAAAPPHVPPVLLPWKGPLLQETGSRPGAVPRGIRSAAAFPLFFFRSESPQSEGSPWPSPGHNDCLFYGDRPVPD